MDRNWAGLPAHILDSVVERLELVSDYLRFSAVCMPWYRVAMESKPQQAKLSLTNGRPMLLVSADVEDTWNVYNVLENKVLNLQVNLPNKRFCGGSKGWLVTVEEDFTVTLTNPFLRIKGSRNVQNSIIRLPPLKGPADDDDGQLTRFWAKRCEDYVLKAAISADPVLDTDKCIVMVICRSPVKNDWCMQTMAFFRIGQDESWTYIDDVRFLADVIFIDDKHLGPNFFAIDTMGLLFGSDASSDTDAPCYISDHEDDGDDRPTPARYLVVDGEDLLLIERIFDEDEDEEADTLITTTIEFKVFELDRDEKKWNEKNNLSGDIAIFVGDNTAIPVIASKFSGCEPNCIYFVPDHKASPTREDYGVYNIGNRSFSQGSYSTAVTLLNETKQYPMWVVPSFPQ